MLTKRHLSVAGAAAVVTAAILGSLWWYSGWHNRSESGSAPPVEDYLALLGPDRRQAERALARIEASWHPGSHVMLLELVQFVQHRPMLGDVTRLLERQTGESHGRDLHAWYRLVLRSRFEPHPQYAEFKARLYSKIDPRFAEYFGSDRPAAIRLDEIRWGGVKRDGIPPLKDPRMIEADAAAYLDDSHIVFGVAMNGEAKAYPKRILAWHEMVKDTVGGVSLNGVYCTLCGSMIVYETVSDSKHYELGTSGFLYRSNKLMYDHETKSLWSTLAGKPVVGPLVGKGIELKRHYVVTTTWGEWKYQHPETKVLSLNTGYDRDYGEGVAYHSYFSTDELMFDVPVLDTRLKNKDEVLALRWDEEDVEPLAISTDFLAAHPVYHDRAGPHEFVVLTDSSGANRVYETNGVRFESYQTDGTAVDRQGNPWQLSEAKLTGPGSRTLRRLPAHRAFWFGWYSAYPETRLVRSADDAERGE